MLLECLRAVQVWPDVHLWDTIDRTLHQNYNMNALIFSLLLQLQSAQSELFVTIMWSLWKRKNLKLWQQQNETSRQVVERATHLLEDWRAAQHIQSQRTTSICMSQVSIFCKQVSIFCKSYGCLYCPSPAPIL